MILLFGVVKNPYRFTQLGAGWVLRDVSVHSKAIVIDFLNRHKDDMIKEAVRYATEKMSPSDKKKVEALRKVTRGSFAVSFVLIKLEPLLSVTYQEQTHTRRLLILHP